jgi:SAM-dependent methyltransferase
MTATPPDPRVYAILRESGYGDDLFNPRQHRNCELVDDYVRALAIELVAKLGLVEPLARARTVDELVELRGFVPVFRPPLAWLLAWLAAGSVLAREDERYRLAAPLPATNLAGLRGEGLALDPSYAPAYALLDHAATIYPGVATGDTSGERALFQKAALWFAYFSNDHAYYALNNRVVGPAAAARLPASGATVLEVGAGLGSATEALLEALSPEQRSTAVAAYRFTEPVTFFSRRAQRILSACYPAVPFTFSALDIDAPWEDQGVAPGSVQLVWGVNVFHLARDLRATLRAALTALAPGGALVIGEGIRPFAGQPVAAEFPFQLLERFVDVEISAARPAPGFMTAEQWQAALADAGFEAIETVPDVVRLRALYPGFFAAAICGRRPR